MICNLPFVLYFPENWFIFGQNNIEQENDTEFVSDEHLSMPGMLSEVRECFGQHS